jgi:nicotinamidase-related amidase
LRIGFEVRNLPSNEKEALFKMTNQVSFDPARSAVLSMDLQSAIVSIYTQGKGDLLVRAASVLKKSRAAGMSILHVQVGFRPGCPEISTRNSLFGAIKNSVQHRQIFEGEAGAIHPAVAPEGEDMVVIKHRISAFAGTDLEMILRARDIDTLVLFGIATSGVVLSTLLHACDADYRLVIIGDCCADLEADVHTCLVEKFFPKRGTVMSAAEFEEALESR